MVDEPACNGDVLNFATPVQPCAPQAADSLAQLLLTLTTLIFVVLKRGMKHEDPEGPHQGLVLTSVSLKPPRPVQQNRILVV